MRQNAVVGKKPHRLVRRQLALLYQVRAICQSQRQLEHRLHRWMCMRLQIAVQPRARQRACHRHLALRLRGDRLNLVGQSILCEHRQSCKHEQKSGPHRLSISIRASHKGAPVDRRCTMDGPRARPRRSVRRPRLAQPSGRLRARPRRPAPGRRRPPLRPLRPRRNRRPQAGRSRWTRPSWRHRLRHA